MIRYQRILNRMQKRRLHDTIRSLNRNQKEGRLRFKGDGTGEGIVWEGAPPLHLE